MDFSQSFVRQRTVRTASRFGARSFGLGQTRIPIPVIALYSKQLGSLLRAGVPLVQSLRLLQRQDARGALRTVVQEQIRMLEHGQRFSATLRAWPSVFEPMYVSLVVAGERAGVLNTVLERLGQHYAQRVRAISKMRSAMVYPVVVLFASLFIVSGMLVWVVPQFEAMFASMLQGARLPALTQCVVDASRWVKSGWPVLLLIAAGTVGIVRLLGRFDQVKQGRDALLLRIPILGPLLLKSALARCSRSLGTLLESAVPMLDALATATATLQNRALEHCFHHLRNRVREGSTIAACLEQESLIPPMFAGMVEVGETTGALPTMLIEIAESFEADVEVGVEGLLTLIEPLLILGLAATIGFLVIALFLPMVELMKHLGV